MPMTFNGYGHNKNQNILYNDKEDQYDIGELSPESPAIPEEDLLSYPLILSAVLPLP
jgi:hypothetical protein